MMKKWFLCLSLVVAVTGRMPAQDAPPAAATNAGPALAGPLDDSIESLGALLKAIESKERSLMALRDRLNAAQDEVARATLLEELRELTQQENELKDQFDRFAVGVDTSVFRQEVEKAFNWQEEVGSLLKPILAEFKNATAESRSIGELRAQIEELQKLKEVAAQGVSNLENLVHLPLNPVLSERLNLRLAVWHQRKEDAANQQKALQLQLDNLLEQRKSAFDSTTRYARNFVRTRGLNLLLAVVAFCSVFLGVRGAYRIYRKLHPIGRDRSFATRLGALVFHLVSVAGGIIATLLVLNFMGDWFLLGIVLILLVGIAWASIKTLPQYMDTAKLILNIGAVKESERLVYDGIPWKVDSLGFSVRLVNPLLDGGVQLLPVNYLVGMHSRPLGEKEEWFPCRAGDWVELRDGRSGKVVYQTPSLVQLVELGGSQVGYATADFVAQAPRVLSTGFRIAMTFGIDYRHQAISTTEIPEKLAAYLAARLATVAQPEHIKHVAVALERAGASALEYAVEVDLDGAAAPQRVILQHAISRCLVEACNEYGWTIPFPQVVVHQIDQADGGVRAPLPAKAGT